MALPHRPLMETVSWWRACPQLWVRTGSEDRTDCIPGNAQHSERQTSAIVFLPFNPSCLSEAQGFDTAMLMSSLETSRPA